jgi:hypothetical protein
MGCGPHWPPWAALGRPARSLAAKCQTNLVLSVRSAILPGGETERQRSVASGKWPCSRLLPMSWPGEASRPTTVSSATGGASRRIAVSCPCEASRAIAGSCRAEPRDILLVFPGCARSEAGLASLRPSEHSETLRVGARRPGVHRSGLVQRSGAVCKAGESGQGAGGTVPILGNASVGSVKPGGCLFLTRSEATRFGLSPRLKSGGVCGLNVCWVW